MGVAVIFMLMTVSFLWNLKPPMLDFLRDFLMSTVEERVKKSILLNKKLWSVLIAAVKRGGLWWILWGLKLWINLVFTWGRT